MKLFLPKLKPQVVNWTGIIEDYLLPPSCVLCGNAGFNKLDLCDCCFRHLTRNSRCCYQCARVMETSTMLCGACLSSPPAFDNTIAPFLYQASMRHLILSLKSGADYKNARLLGLLLAEFVKGSPLPECILPVPLHKSRYRERGFNQVIEIAKTVTKELHIPLHLDDCVRHRNTPHQTKLTAKQRRKNMKNAFSLIKPIEAEHVAIIDDVMTTGATVHELAVVLKKAGVKRVDVWVCARA